MGTFAVIVVTAALGVDFGWEPDLSGQVQFIIQIEPALLDALKEGDSIINEIPPEAKGVRRFVIRVGEGEVPRIGLSPESPGGVGSGDGGSGDKQPLIANPANEKTLAEEPAIGGPGIGDIEKEPTSKYGLPPGALSPSTPSPSTLSPPSRYSSQSRYSNSGESSSQADPKGVLQPPRFSPKVRMKGSASDVEIQAEEEPKPTKRADESQGNHSQKKQAATDPNRGDDSRRPIEDLAGSPAPLPTASSAKPLVNRQAVYEEPSPSDEPVNPTVSDELSKAQTAASTGKPWLPLVITSLLLFASIGANLYLGWMAWEFYGRLREKMDDAQAGVA